MRQQNDFLLYSLTLVFHRIFAFLMVFFRWIFFGNNSESESIFLQRCLMKSESIHYPLMFAYKDCIAGNGFLANGEGVRTGIDVERRQSGVDVRCSPGGNC